MKKLSDREKKLVILAGCAAALFIAWRFLVSPMLDYDERIGKAIPRMEIDLRKARLLSSLHEKLKGEVQTIRARVDERKEAFNPYDFLDKLARKQGIRAALDKISFDTEEVTDDYNEEIVSIRFKDVPLDKLVRYLYDIETSGRLLTVKSLSIEPDERDSNLLDVDFDVSTFVKNTEKGSDTDNEKGNSARHRRSVRPAPRHGVP